VGLNNFAQTGIAFNAGDDGSTVTAPTRVAAFKGKHVKMLAGGLTIRLPSPLRENAWHGDAWTATRLASTWPSCQSRTRTKSWSTNATGPVSAGAHGHPGPCVRLRRRGVGYQPGHYEGRQGVFLGIQTPTTSAAKAPMTTSRSPR